MSVKTSRRTFLASALAAALITRGVRAQELGKIEGESALSLVPALPAYRTGWPTSILTWADISGYCQAAGIEKPGSFGEDTVEIWSGISERIPLNENALFLFMSEPWPEMVGFAPWDVDQVGVSGDPPEQVRLYRGTFDPERIGRAFAQWGYASSSAGDVRILTNPADGMDLTRDLDRLTLGAFNNVAVTDSLVIASRSADVFAATLGVAAGDESLADAGGFAAITRALDQMHGFALFNGNILWAELAHFLPRSSVAEINELRARFAETGVLPPARVFAGGLTVIDGGADVDLLVDFETPAAALDAVKVIETRIATLDSTATRQPYAGLLAGYEVNAINRTGVARVRVPDEAFQRRWMQMIYRLDLLFLATGNL